MSQADNLFNEPWRGGPGESNRAYLHSHSVQDFNELYVKDENFRVFARQVYHYFDYMPVGEKLNLDYPPQQLEWVLLTFIAFVNESYHYLEFFLTDDYTQIYHDYISPSAREYAIQCFKAADEAKRKAKEQTAVESESPNDNLLPAA